MPSPSSNETPSAHSSQRLSLVLAAVAAVALVGNCLLSSPAAFSHEHQKDRSLLKLVVSVLSLAAPSAERSAFPTLRGIEIRNLFFYCGAALLLLAVGAKLLLRPTSTRLSADDLFELRDRAAGPHFWWGLLLAISVITSAFSHAPEICKGQVVIRFLHFAWWWPLAAFLVPRHARRLAGVLLASIAATTLLGIWYFTARVEPAGVFTAQVDSGWLIKMLKAQPPQRRLQFPIGNEGWFAACILPGVLIALGLAARSFARSHGSSVSEAQPRAPSPGRSQGIRWPMLIASLFALLIFLVALWLTQARAAGVGLAAGVFAMLILAAPRKAQLPITLIGLLLGIYGAHWFYNLAEHGVMGQRAHSIRSRVDHEWPYALSMFTDKPVGGWGEGCYAMRAGQLARRQQFEDPSVIAVEDHWTAHAHNEWLELLADVGLAGAGAIAVALIITLYWSLKHCDILRGRRDRAAERWLVIALAAALVALIVEESAGVALRYAGFPPIFVTVWAVLWALVREQRRQASAEEAARVPAATVRLGGALAVCAALVLGFYGISDWRAARSWFESQRTVAEGRPADALASADFAAARVLDPERSLEARLWAIRARTLAFKQAVQGATAANPPSDQTLAFAQDALRGIDALDSAAPRFLWLSDLRWQLYRLLADAFHLCGDAPTAESLDENALLALERLREDEPFDVNAVEILCRDARIIAARRRLWQRAADLAAPARHLRDRFHWLQALLRRRLIDDRFVRLVQTFGVIPGAPGVVDDASEIARQDATADPADWRDPLSPETLRVAALVNFLGGQPGMAADLARDAEKMYEAVGPRLFVAHTAAIHEKVRYRFQSDPLANTADLLAELARAHQSLTGIADPASKLPLPDELGETRLLILLAADRTEDALLQLGRIRPHLLEPAPRDLAPSLAVLGRQFARDLGPLALNWARMAVELDPALAEARFALLLVCLEEGADAEALQAAEGFLAAAPDRPAALQTVVQLEANWPNRPTWDELRRRHPDLPAPLPPAGRPTMPPSDEADPQPAAGEPSAKSKPASSE